MLTLTDTPPRSGPAPTRTPSPADLAIYFVEWQLADTEPPPSKR